MKEFIVALIALIFLIVGVTWLSKNLKENEVEEMAAGGNLVSEKGIHWHPELSVTIKGEGQIIPTNIGMGMQYAGHPQYDPMMMMANMHTHDASGQIHWEVMEGPVEKDDVRLSHFFSVWGKKFTKSCIFDYCNGPDGVLTFRVNGQDNMDFENYLVKDKDKIEIIFN